MTTLYEYFDETPDDIFPVQFSPLHYTGEQFTVGAVGTNEAFTITSLEAYLRGHGGASGILTFYLYAVDGEGKPTGDILSSGTTDGSTISLTGEWREIVMTPFVCEASTQYIIYGSISSGSVDWWCLDAGGYAGGKCGYYSGGWTIYDAQDLLFKIYGSPYVEPGPGPTPDKGGYKSGSRFLKTSWDELTASDSTKAIGHQQNLTPEKASLVEKKDKEFI